jgi:galactofuranose transport system substrate-binding protein
MRRRRLLAVGVALLGGAAAGCGPAALAGLPPSAAPTPVSSGPRTYQDLVVGFAQIGAESAWRVANTVSMKETADDLGVELKFADGQQRQDNQIRALRQFIAMQVDVIGISPVVETGWADAFREVKDAGIPLVLVDRRADVPDDLYASYLGSDFREEGRNAARVMAGLVHGRANIVELVGTLGSAPANDRYAGFREILDGYPDLRIIASESGDFTRAKGREVMAGFLQRFGRQITALYAHNDDMAMGAIQAIGEYGLRPGTDITIVSVDGIHDAFQAMVDGRLNATVECNPLLGPQFYELALKVVNGQPVPKWVPSKESVFLADSALQILPTRKY